MEKNIARDSKGRLLPGSVANPAGRPPKSKEDAYLNAIKANFTPEQLVAVLKQLLETTDGWRAKYAAAELILHYSLGKPTQRVLTGNLAQPEDWLAAFEDKHGEECIR